jgi:hypothetical protein
MPNNGSLCSILRITEYDSIFVEHLIYLFWSNVLKEAVNQGVKMVKHEEFWFFPFFVHSLIGHVLEYNPS